MPPIASTGSATAAQTRGQRVEARHGACPAGLLADSNTEPNTGSRSRPASPRCARFRLECTERPTRNPAGAIARTRGAETRARGKVDAGCARRQRDVDAIVDEHTCRPSRDIAP